MIAFPFTNGFAAGCCGKSCLWGVCAFSRRSLLERKLVAFDQPIPNAAVGPFHDCGVATRRYRDENGRFEIVTRSKADVLENGSLAVSPVVIAPDGRSVSVVNFQERIGQRIWNTKGTE